MTTKVFGNDHKGPFAKPVKAISLPQDVPSTSNRRLIELENQVQRLMEAHLAPWQHVQVNKITSSCEICSGPHDTQYCMENHEQSFIEYASSQFVCTKGDDDDMMFIELIKKTDDSRMEEPDVGNFTYVLDFMIVEDISSIVDPRLSQVVFGRPFIDVSNMTHDLSSGVVRFTNGAEEIAYKMPHKIEQYNSLSDLEKEHTKSVYLRNKEDKRRGVNYVVSKILGFYKECLELGPEYVTGLEDEGKVFSIWKAFGGNTRDLGSFGKETDETTDLHQHCSRISPQKLETASQITRKAFTNPTTTTSQDMATASSRMIQPIIKNILVTTVLYLMKEGLEVLRKFHWNDSWRTI
ncbi:hypothetical protein Tco_0282178 [Tanacetum coccineum]